VPRSPAEAKFIKPRCRLSAEVFRPRPFIF